MVAGSIARPHGRRKKKGRPRKPSGHVPPSKQHRRKRCRAHARTTGKPCRRWAMANGRCMMHGGKTPKGNDHPAFKTGERSKYLLSSIQQFLKEEPQSAEDLANLDMYGLDDEVRLAVGMLSLYLQNRPRPEEVTGDWIVTAARLIDRVCRQKERNLRMRKHHRTITLEEFQDAIRKTIILVSVAFEKTVKDKKLMDEFLDRLEKIPEQMEAFQE